MLAEYRQFLKILKKIKDYELILIAFVAAAGFLAFLLSSRLSSLKTQTVQLSDNLDKVKAGLALKEEEEKRLRDLLLENANLKTEVRELSAANMARLRSSAADPPNDVLRSENNTLKIDNSALKNNNISLQSKADGLQSENTALKKENADLRSHRSTQNDLRTDNDMLKSENDRLRAENDHLRAQINSLQITLIRTFQEGEHGTK